MATEVTRKSVVFLNLSIKARICKSVVGSSTVITVITVIKKKKKKGGSVDLSVELFKVESVRVL